jgi:tetratricopeptide (TPR) repeat protein
MTKVFISYSHLDEVWKNRLQKQLDALEMNDFLSVWEDRQIEVGDDWYPEIEKALNDAKIAILLISANFLKSKFIVGKEVPCLLERRKNEGIRVIPLILNPCPWRKVEWLSAIQGASPDNIELSGLSKHKRDSILSKLAEKVYDLLKSSPASVPSGGFQIATKIFIDYLPIVSGGFFGREEELKLLDYALAGNGTKIIQFIAAGGTGKTKLLRHWLNQHDADIPNRIIWSFYSQGSAEDKQVSSSTFFTEAFKALLTVKTEFSSEEEKGDTLADLLIQHRCLLVLDGLEPLQYAGKGMGGRLKDRAIKRLLQKLAAQHTSVCVITTRIRVHDLSDRPHVKEWPLDNLQPEDGLALLRSLGVKGSDTELKNAAREYGHHALALHLLGNALTTYLDGDIQKRDTLDELFGVDAYCDVERHAFKVMQAYQQWLHDTSELQLLYLLGLFDHPIETEVLEALWQTPIPHLTAGIPQNTWLNAVRSLREKHRLLSTHEGRPDLLDCHPMIREYFGRQLRAQRPEGWRLAHERLYEYYKALPKKDLPDTLEEMQPLFFAVAHGCAAELHRRALYEIYMPRIQRKEEFYISKILGAFSDDLATVVHFFISPWQKLSPNIKNEHDKGQILSITGYLLKATGRLKEAVLPMTVTLDIFVSLKSWDQAAGQASNLSELQLILGNVTEATQTAQRSVDYADKSENMSFRIGYRTTYADALHQLGDDAAALAIFQEAERFQKKLTPWSPQLFSQPGFNYCDLLLAQGRTKEVLERSKNSLRIAKYHKYLQDIALNQLTKGIACLQMKQFSVASTWLDRALSSLRKGAFQQYVVSGLLAHASLSRQIKNFSSAHHDLQEVYDIVESSGMQLHLTEYHLEMARLIMEEAEVVLSIQSHLAPGEKGLDMARAHLKNAADLITETGYQRRIPELRMLHQKLAMLAQTVSS